MGSEDSPHGLQKRWQLISPLRQMWRAAWEQNSRPRNCAFLLQTTNNSGHIPLSYSLWIFSQGSQYRCSGPNAKGSLITPPLWESPDLLDEPKNSVTPPSHSISSRLWSKSPILNYTVSWQAQPLWRLGSTAGPLTKATGTRPCRGLPLPLLSLFSHVTYGQWSPHPPRRLPDFLSWDSSRRGDRASWASWFS